MYGSLFLSKKTAVHCILGCYMHGSLFFSKKSCRALYFGMLYARQPVFSKKTAVHCILECYMHGSLFFSENTAVYYILECYMDSSSIQFVVFKPLSYCFEETIGFDK